MGNRAGDTTGHRDGKGAAGTGKLDLHLYCMPPDSSLQEVHTGIIQSQSIPTQQFGSCFFSLCCAFQVSTESSMSSCNLATECSLVLINAQFSPQTSIPGTLKGAEMNCKVVLAGPVSDPLAQASCLLQGRGPPEGGVTRVCSICSATENGSIEEACSDTQPPYSLLIPQTTEEDPKVRESSDIEVTPVLRTAAPPQGSWRPCGRVGGGGGKECTNGCYGNQGSQNGGKGKGGPAQELPWQPRSLRPALKTKPSRSPLTMKYPGLLRILCGPESRVEWVMFSWSRRGFHRLFRDRRVPTFLWEEGWGLATN